MKRTTTLTLLLAIAACRGGGSGDDGTTGDDAGTADTINSDDVSIYDIQGSLLVGSAVNVRGVVVTAIDNYGSKKGNFWVEEPAGGPLSGVLVFGADLGQVANLAVGDLVDITGAVKDEFALTADTSGRTTTELDAPSGGALTVTKTGTGTVPAPEMVDALAIGQMADADRDAQWEMWEGVLITVPDVKVTGSVQQIGGQNPDPTLQKFPITGDAYAESSLAAFPTVASGDCLGGITGVGDYFFDWLIEPTSTGDVVTGGANCPLAETGATACQDGVDNDGNGHTDCGDFSCDTDAVCITATTVTAIQDGTGPGVGDGQVTLSSVVVTAITTNNKYLWVQDGGGAAQYNGVYIYRGSSAAPLSGIVVGTKVDIANAVVSSFTVTGSTDPTTELTTLPGTTMTLTAGNVAVPAALTGATVADLIGANAEHYEGVLVTLTNVRVVAGSLPDDAPTPANKDFSIGDATNNLVVDDFANSQATTTTPAANDCLASVTGVVHQRSSTGAIVVEPRSALDIVPNGTNCP